MHSLNRFAAAVLALAVLHAPPARAQTPDPAALPLHPGDRVLVRIFADTSLSDTLHVDHDGSVMLPRLGPLSLANVPASAVGDSVRKAYSTILRPVAVEVTPLRRVSVVGEVRKPDVLFLETRATVRDAISLAGGIDDIGQTDPVLLMRNGRDIPLDHWRSRGDPEVIVRSGDVVIVQREPWVKRNIFSIISGVGIVVSL
ncbi:MAG: hypothetical protein B7Z72_12320, partial [Gemmatimonadetes bacterium 21-71-4]